jgi:iron(III) transport system ATP-binding protein
MPASARPPEKGLALRCRGLAKRFGSAVALDGFDLDLPSGALLALLGPSGCGKTTALRVVAGFERPDSGEVYIGERRVTGPGLFVAPEQRRIGMVFQDWALFPHLDVLANVRFGLPRSGAARAAEVLEMVGLDNCAHRMPHELSGGQQQRVALARALAPSPEVILLDEPFSNLDAALRARVRADVRRVLRDADATAIFVTHDQDEALSIADEVAVMSGGRVLQAGSPHHVYRAPASRAVATLVGEANFLPAEVVGERALTPLGSLPAPAIPDGTVEAMIRPESLQVEPDDTGNARVVDAEFYGHDQLVKLRCSDGTPVTARLLGPRSELVVGAPVAVTAMERPLFFVDGRPVGSGPAERAGSAAPRA